MTTPISINKLSQKFSDVVSTSPELADSSLQNSFRGRRFSTSQRPEKVLKPFNEKEIRILLLENVNQSAIDILTKKGYNVEFLESSLPEDELIEKIKDVNVIGIRSKTKITKKVLDAATNLIAIGCFCIGTNQVDLEYASRRGIAVFNSPFSNSRSVAELVIAYAISLARQIGDRSIELHSGTWNKVSKGCWEIRGKTLGIIGYGHIGSQLSVLSEAFGMHVIFYDVVNLMALGQAQQVDTLEDLLANSDFVTLHVPELPETKNLINKDTLKHMRKGSYLINASRGSVVDIPALVDAMKEKRLAGCALDVYPNEPGKNGANQFTDSLNSWTSDLVSLPNVILTPHIGGSTAEAQRAIGIEVGTALTKFISEGSTVGSVNYPEVDLRRPYQGDAGSVRVLYSHRNVPGVLRTINELLAAHNIEKQFCDSEGELAYLMADLSSVKETELRDLYNELNRTSTNIRTRVLY